MNMFSIFTELDKLNESFDDRQELIAKLKALGKNYYFDKYSDEQLYRMLERAEAEQNEQPTLETKVEKQVCDKCSAELTDGGFCPNCDDGVDDLVNESLSEGIFDSKATKRKSKNDDFAATRDELSTYSAIQSVVDQVKAVYEAGFFSRLPIGRDNAFTLSISGPDKERLAGYFKKQPEFNYELNTDHGIVSHEFISDKYDIEIYDDFISMYKIPQNESINNLNKKNIKETDSMNFTETLLELDKLYNDLDSEDIDEGLIGSIINNSPVGKIASAVTSLGEDVDEEDIPLDDIEDDEAQDEDIEVVDSEDENESEVKQLVIECSNCGSVFIKNADEVEVNEETDLANVGEVCGICEETKGYKILGELVPYEESESVTEGMFGAKKEKALTRAIHITSGVDSKDEAVSILHDIQDKCGIKSDSETTEVLIHGKKKAFALCVPSSDVAKAIKYANKKYSNVKFEVEDDFDIARLQEERVKKGSSSEEPVEDNLEEILDIKLDARGFGGSGNNVDIV